ncbi:MAG: FHA domain-containing protein [Acidobacteria bacterium]|nr:MAG: FHA domain-containing protein [Acidobacteriota bacterium]
MKKAKIKFLNQEIPIEETLITLGRATDNKICINEQNVSRYHAEIEFFDNSFWLTDLKSSNGTFINDEPVTSTVQLKNSDRISLGGVELEFYLDDELQKDQQRSEENIKAPAAASLPLQDSTVAASLAECNEPPVAKSKPMHLILGIAAISLVIIGASMFLFLPKVNKGCDAWVYITNPESGETITNETEINLSISNGACINRIILKLDDKPIAELDVNASSIKIDPKDFPELADGMTHTLQAIIEDEKGNLIPASSVLVVFETAELPTSSPTPEEEQTAQTETQSLPRKNQVSLIEVQQMIQAQIRLFSNRPNYRLDPQFIEEVRKKTTDYSSEAGFFERALPYQDLINMEFHKENGIDAPVGFLIAMSRSKFRLEKQGKQEGLWQLSEEFVKAGGYKSVCELESLSDKTQSCAAKTAAAYTKALLIKIFNGDIVFTVAAFGMTEQEASLWAASLPQNKENFWQLIKNPQQRENIVRFFAASIVANNPGKFGLKRDKPILILYASLIQ